MVKEILEILNQIPSEYQGIERIRTALEAEKGKGFEGLPDALSDSRTIFEGNLYHAQAGILYRELQHGGEVVVDEKKIHIGAIEYNLLTYLGNQDNFGKHVSVQQIERDTRYRHSTIQTIVPKLRSTLHGKLEEGMERVIGGPSNGYCFTEPTRFIPIRRRLKK